MTFLDRSMEFLIEHVMPRLARPDGWRAEVDREAEREVAALFGERRPEPPPRARVSRSFTPTAVRLDALPEPQPQAAARDRRLIRY